MFDVRAIFAAKDLHIASAIRMGAEIFQCSRAATGSESFGLLCRQHVNCAVDANGENLIGGFEVHIGAIMQDEGPEAAKVRDDRQLRFGMNADFAGQGQELQRRFQFDIDGIESARNGSAFGFSLAAFGHLSQLQIGAKAAHAAGNFFARIGVKTEFDAFWRNGRA